MLQDKGFLRLLPAYPLIIQQFVDDYRLMEGVAYDIGCGPGFLGIELAKVTHMKICFVDKDQTMLEKAQMGFHQALVDNAYQIIHKKIEDLHSADNKADFVMSRGSLWFWEEPKKGLKVIEELLKPGGRAIVGGGLGRYMPDTMRKRLKKTIKERLQATGQTRPTLEQLEKLAQQAGLKKYKVFSDGPEKGGRWIEIKKSL